MNQDAVDLGDRMKSHEAVETGRRLPSDRPIVARLDGRSFSKLTRSLKRPYEEGLSRLMIESTKHLVTETNANCGYTQSDEITLTWFAPEVGSEVFFGGRVSKMTSVLAAMLTGFFNRQVAGYVPGLNPDAIPTFDCRVYSVPDVVEGANVFVWRERDATKNSISMAARALFSHKQLDGKHGGEMKAMMLEKGVDWGDYPAFFTRGTYVQRRRVVRPFTAEEVAVLPQKHEARQNPGLLVERNEVNLLPMPPIVNVINRPLVIYSGADPLVEDANSSHN